MNCDILKKHTRIKSFDNIMAYLIVGKRVLRILIVIPIIGRGYDWEETNSQIYIF